MFSIGLELHDKYNSSIIVGMSGQTKKLTTLSKKGLTLPQTKLVESITRQIKERGKPNLSHAGLQAFDTINPVSAGIMASQALAIPSVKDALEESLARNGLSLDETLTRINKIAGRDDVKITGDQVLKANLALLKLHTTKLAKGNSLIGRANVVNFNFNEAKEKLEELNTDSSKLLGDVEG